MGFIWDLMGSPSEKWWFFFLWNMGISWNWWLMTMIAKLVSITPPSLWFTQITIVFMGVINQETFNATLGVPPCGNPGKTLRRSRMMKMRGSCESYISKGIWTKDAIRSYINIKKNIDTLIKIRVMKEDKYDITIIVKNDIATRWCPLVIRRLIARIN